MEVIELHNELKEHARNDELMWHKISESLLQTPVIIERVANLAKAVEDGFERVNKRFNETNSVHSDLTKLIEHHEKAIQKLELSRARFIGALMVLGFLVTILGGVIAYITTDYINSRGQIIRAINNTEINKEKNDSQDARLSFIESLIKE